MMQFNPTWLYIKQHNETGLKYFGKTIRDPMRYNGSGTHWKRHIDKHGDDVTTIWCQLFTDIDQLVEYATKFSIENNIIESKEWANIKLENGLDGGMIGYKVTDETKQKISNTTKGRPSPLKGRTITEEQKRNISIASAKRKHSKETRYKMSLIQQNRSAETNLKISNAKRGHTVSLETRAKISETLRNKKRGIL